MELFDPFLTFRVFLAVVFSGIILYDLIDLTVWYRGLPRLARKIIILKLLGLKSGVLRTALFLIVLLFLIQGWLMMLLFQMG